MEKKTFDNVQHPFMRKVLKKLGVEEMCLSIIKTASDKPIVHVILNVEKQKSFPQKSAKHCPLSSF
jgi:hypothetical protein